MAKIVWTDEALEWLEQIGDFLSERSLAAASKVTEGIYLKAHMLVDHPQIGYRIPDILDREVRVLLYGHYRIFYEFRENDEIRILAVIHTSLDLERFNF